ncbi:unnamed protein product [marine sediment metagenome]|uniref:Uncharacterized protein n=1 Tax=marine sediment metagenome TaxID=412755 RepID=X1UAV7_9ZZZZ
MTWEIILKNGTHIRFNKFREIHKFLGEVAYLRELFNVESTKDTKKETKA